MKGPDYGSEAELVRWWRSLRTGRGIPVSNGHTVHLLEGGRSNPHDGPDVKEASFILEGRLFRGDVECHLREKEWFSHGHHLDSRYNDVVLHVVAVEGDHRAVTQAGEEIQVVVAAREEKTGPSRYTCGLEGTLSGERLLECLLPLAYGRWLGRVDVLRDGIRALGGPREAFYVHSFWALGLKGNEDPFKLLAKAVPLSDLRSLETSQEVEEALLGYGGFSPGRLRQFRPVVESSRWVRRGLRPHAYPRGRIRFGAVLVRALSGGWEPWRDGLRGTVESLRTAFPGPELPGRGWCGEWLGNVILPFQEAWGQLDSGAEDGELFSRWFHIDLGYAYGELRRRFGAHVSNRDLTNFGIQQGLLALVDRYCNLDLCGVCPLKA